MNNESRKVNTIKNAATSILNQVISLLFSFVTRSIFIYYLGAEYLGISGLFTNILQVLSMADLGFGTAIVFSMYRPIAEEDKKTQIALMNFYKKVYHYVAFFVALIGIALIPVLPYIIKTDLDIKYVILYYVLYLSNTVVSYLFVYKISITIAHQKSYLLNNYDSIFCIIRSIMQIIVLIFFKSFILYLAIQIIVGWVNNFVKAYRSQKMYPYIKGREELDPQLKKEIFYNIKSMFIYRIGGVLLNNTDNILISTMIGTIVVGYYSNYTLLVNAVTTFTNLLLNSMTASIGNLNVSVDMEKRYLFFKRFNFATWWLFSFCGVCFLVLLNDFITIWLGEEFVLDFFVLIAIVLNFVMPGSIRIVSLYRDTTGIFRQTKYIFFVTSIINLILSIILGKVTGLTGILMATVLSRLMTNMWFEPFILFQQYFKKNAWKYYFSQQIYYWMIFLLCSVITYFIANTICPNISIYNLFLKFIICLILPNMIMIIFFYKTDEMKYFKHIGAQLLERVCSIVHKV